MKQIIKTFFKIAILSLLLIFLFSYFFGNKQSFKSTTNAEYKEIEVLPISQVGVAITTNIGIGGINQKQKIKETYINKQVFSPNDFYNNNPKIKDALIKNNMIFTKEYYSILKANLNKILQKSKNRSETLKNIIKQLKIRYKNAIINLNNLKKQKEILSQEYEKITTQIETLKKNLENNFNKNLTEKVFKNVDDYYILKNKQIILKTNIIFINNFIKKYNYLNKYNEILINSLELNKDIISKNSYLVIPKSGTKILKELDLLYSEEEFKKQKTR